MLKPNVDKEIEEIRRSIEKIHWLFYKVYRTIENVTGRVEVPLDAFDSALIGARENVSKVRDDFNAIIVRFPSFHLYLTILILVEAIIFALLIFLLYKIFDGIHQLRRSTAKAGKYNTEFQPHINPDMDLEAVPQQRQIQPAPIPKGILRKHTQMRPSQKGRTNGRSANGGEQQQKDPLLASVHVAEDV